MNATRPTAAIFRLKGDQSGPYKYVQTRSFADYWFGLPKLGLVPQKSSITPRKIVALLPGAIMLEKTPSGGFRVRLSGTGNLERWEFEATNANYLSFAPPLQHGMLIRKFDLASEYPCGLVLAGNELYTSGRIVQTETVLFPMRPQSAGQAILFGLITADPERDAVINGDTLACVHFTISSAQFINIGAGTPV